MTKSHKGDITRRGFFGRSAGAVATAGILAGHLDATEAGPDPGRKLDRSTADPAPKCGKIALEEHFALPGTIPDSYTSLPTPESRLQIQDLGGGRIAEMDRTNLEVCILSESGPASIQTVLKTSEAVDRSRRSNDYLAEHIAKYPKRLKAFAALPMQDPQAAAQELTRCVYGAFRLRMVDLVAPHHERVHHRLERLCLGGPRLAYKPYLPMLLRILDSRAAQARI